VAVAGDQHRLSAALARRAAHGLGEPGVPQALCIDHAPGRGTRQPVAVRGDHRVLAGRAFGRVESLVKAEADGPLAERRGRPLAHGTAQIRAANAGARNVGIGRGRQDRRIHVPVGPAEP